MIYENMMEMGIELKKGGTKECKQKKGGTYNNKSLWDKDLLLYILKRWDKHFDQRWDKN
jgi:hypothetical protein